MGKRNKLYYPSTQIIPNLFTYGKEWMYQDGIEYVGYYHRYIDGVIMSGANYLPDSSKTLIPYAEVAKQPSNAIYDTLKRKQTYASPYQIYPIPIIDDYEAGKIARYFLKRRNFSAFQDIIEINKDQYKLWLQPNSGIDEYLYTAINLDWKLTGPLRDNTDSDNTVYGVYDTNARMVALKDRSFPGLRAFLTNFIELSIYSPAVDKKYKDLFGK